MAVDWCAIFWGVENPTMFTVLKPLVTAGVMLCVISEGFTQDVPGIAYEFSGLTKYYTVPSKLIFGNREILESAVVDGYKVSQNQSDYSSYYAQIEDRIGPQDRENQSDYVLIPVALPPDGDSTDCTYIALQSSLEGWWSQPSYRVVPDSLESPIGLDCMPSSAEVEQFVVNRSLAQELQRLQDSAGE